MPKTTTGKKKLSKKDQATMSRKRDWETMFGLEFINHIDGLLNVAVVGASKEELFNTLAMAHAVLCHKVGQLENVLNPNTDITEMVWKRTGNIINGFQFAQKARKVPTPKKIRSELMVVKPKEDEIVVQVAVAETESKRRRKK